LEAAPIEASGTLAVALASRPVSSGDVFLHHKTTNRPVYEQARSSRPDVDEVLLWNERGELTEATTANLVVKLDGELLTPPASSGLLAGVFRRRLLDEGVIREQVIPLGDLGRCQAIYLVNSVRKWQEAVLRS
jgi:branched-subunit amino acid aminotransferase/4-amino-4-deoxychorismate lyase